MTSVIEQVVQVVALFVEYTRSLSYLWIADWTNLETLSTLFAMVDEIHESLNYSFHWCEKALLLQVVVESASADVGSGYVRADGVEIDILLWQIFTI
jgi:hypothetical protein